MESLFLVSSLGFPARNASAGGEPRLNSVARGIRTPNLQDENLMS